LLLGGGTFFSLWAVHFDVMMAGVVVPLALDMCSFDPRDKQ
jgi:hypothetical protein